MAYRRPGVTVTQEFVGLVPALASFSLPSVVVGPAYQLVDDDALGDYAGADATYGYASLMAGASVDLEVADPADPFPVTKKPVAVVLLKPTVELLPSRTTGVATAASTQLTDPTAGAFDDVAPGDKVVIASGANAGTVTVQKKIDANTLEVNVALQAQTNMPYSVQRTLTSDVELDRVDALPGNGFFADASGIQLPAGLQVVIGALTCDILAAKVEASYRALRTDLAAEVHEIGRISDIDALFGAGQIHPANPLAYALQIMKQNTVTAVNCLGLSDDYQTDESLAFTAAGDVLAGTDMYAIALLTQSSVVATTFKTHVEQLSAAAKKKERVAITNTKLVTTMVLQESSTTGVLAVDGKTIDDPSANFLSNGVAPGHFVTIGADSDAAGRFKIASVPTETQLVLAVEVATGLADVLNLTSYQCDRDLQKSEQAALVAGFSRAIGSRRVVVCWPDSVEVAVGQSVEDVPGYYLCAAVAALTTGLPTQQGLTNLAISGFLGAKHGSKYFDDDQLDTIADGGTMIFAQDGPQQPLYCRHQLTSDRSAIKFQEYSITKNVDFVAKFLRNTYKGFVGQYNIVDTTDAELKATAKAAIVFLRDTTRIPRFGGVLRDGRLKSLIEDPDQIDTIKLRFSCDFPVPLNNVDIAVEA